MSGFPSPASVGRPQPQTRSVATRHAHARALSSAWATKAGRSRRIGPISQSAGNCHPTTRATKQERRST
jgi:hypothetical protein